MADIQTISIVLAAIGICIAAVNSIYSSREAKRQRRVEIETRQAELFMQMYRDWSTPEFRKAFIKMAYHHTWSDVEEFREKYGFNADLDGWVETYVRQATFYEGIGVLVEQGLIDIELVDRLLHNTAISFWEKTAPIWEDFRKKLRPGLHPVYDSAEYLYNQIKQRGQR